MAWDDGIQWFSRRTVAAVEFPVSLDYVKTQVLRVANGTVEDEHITRLIEAATDAAEDATQRALLPQTHELILSGFPCSEILIPRPPLDEIASIYYYDSDNVRQQWGATSPTPYVVIPSGTIQKARIVLDEDETWPTTATRPDAVTITFTAGYASSADIPARIVQGICVHLTEQYRQRSLGVINVQFSPATLQLNHFWKRVPDA
jgi:uncharacterized phiE125 gp8 family phage protein